MVELISLIILGLRLDLGNDLRPTDSDCEQTARDHDLRYIG